MRAVAISALLVLGCATRAPPPRYADKQVVGQPVTFTLPLHPSSTGAVDLANEKGKVVAVHVWATYCEPCRDSVPLYQDLAKEYADRGLRVFALTIDEDLRMVDRFVEEHRVTLPVLWDRDAKVAEGVLGVKQLPTTYVIDRKGVVRFAREGFNEEHLQGYQSELEQLLAEQP